jgi:predicted HD superfamily hydrolase involved in NAD metabolism
MYDFEKYENLIKEKLSDYRYYHSMCVAKKAKQLALKYGVDAEKAYVAGILHDITKEETLEKQREIIEADGYKMNELELGNKNIYHQMSGASYVKNELGINDSDIINGIRYHTTGHANMTLFEMIIYLADFTSEDRTYSDVDIMRQKTGEDILQGMLYSLKHTINDVVSKEKQLHIDTLLCYNWVVNEINKQQPLSAEN